MEHQNKMKTRCRLCFEEVSESVYSVKNVSINSFLLDNYRDTPNFENEEETKFAKRICNVCYMKIVNHQAAEQKHKQKHRRLKPDKKPAFDKQTLLVASDLKITSLQNCFH